MQACRIEDLGRLSDLSHDFLREVEDGYWRTGFFVPLSSTERDLTQTALLQHREILAVRLRRWPSEPRQILIGFHVAASANWKDVRRCAAVDFPRTGRWLWGG